MEDITGFSEQIGVPRFIKKIALPKTAIIKRAATPTTRQSVVVKRAATPAKRQSVVVKRAATPTTRQAVVVKRAATPTTRQAVLVKRAATPTTRQAVAVKRSIFSTAQVPYKKVQAAIKQQQATAVVKRAEAARQPIAVRDLTQVTSPAVVKNATPTQRSYMPVDLPYQNVQPKQSAIRIPSTNYALPTNIDLIEPPVDAGMTNYYGK